MFLVTECLKTLRVNDCLQVKEAVPLSEKAKDKKRSLFWTLNEQNENLLSKLRLPADSPFSLRMSLQKGV